MFVSLLSKRTVAARSVYLITHHIGLKRCVRWGANIFHVAAVKSSSSDSPTLIV